MADVIGIPGLLDRDRLPEPTVAANAATVLARRYLARDERGAVVETPKDLYARVAEAVAGAEADPAARARWAAEFYGVMARGDFVPNSPTLMNAGRRLGMLSACFVLPVEDDLAAIMDTHKATALVQRAGGGTGFAFGRLRPRGAIVASSGGTSAGPLVFIDSLAATSDAIEQGAFRRGANMAIMPIDHPDVIDFVDAKADLGRWQNFNVSVAVTDAFMESLERDPSAAHRVRHERWGDGALWRVGDPARAVAVRDGEDPPDGAAAWSVGDTFELICRRAWSTGEPGLFFVDRANHGNPLLDVLGPIEATNPCGEQPLHAWDSCNLGSVNLAHFVAAGGTGMDWDALGATVATATRFLDDVIEVNTYPLDAIRERSHQTRRIGLGVMGWADALIVLGLPYDSEDARALASNVAEFVARVAERTSAALADEKGCFGAWEGSAYGAHGQRMRNSFRTTVAPTGTVSIIADCSCGIEPLYALAFTRRVLRGADGAPTVMTEVNARFEDRVAAAEVPAEDRAALLAHARTHGTLAAFDWRAHDEARGRAPSAELLEVRAALLASLRTAHEIAPRDHVLMQAAWQEHVDSAVSKTINLRREGTPSEVADAYRLAFASGCKGITVYRDGCRDGLEGMQQPMSLRRQDAASPSDDPSAFAYDEHFQPACRLRVPTPWGNLHLIVVRDPATGREREVFAQLGKAGDLVAADIEGLCRMASRLLALGGTLEDVVEQYGGIGSSQAGPPAPGGPITSVPDAIARGLKRYLERKGRHAGAPPEPIGAAAVRSARDEFMSGYGVRCPQCGGKLAFQEGCRKCTCGYSAC